MDKLYYLDGRMPVSADPDDIKIVELMLNDMESKEIIQELKKQGYSVMDAAKLVVLAKKSRRGEL